MEFLNVSILQHGDAGSLFDSPDFGRPVEMLLQRPNSTNARPTRFQQNIELAVHVQEIPITHDPQPQAEHEADEGDDCERLADRGCFTFSSNTVTLLRFTQVYCEVR